MRRIGLLGLLLVAGVASLSVRSDVVSRGYRVVTLEDRTSRPVTVLISYGRDVDFLLELRGPRVGNDGEWGEQVTAARNAWREYESPVILGMQEALGLRFPASFLEAYIVESLGIPVNKSIMIPLDQTVDRHEFVGVLTHELVHRLIRDNERKSGDSLKVLDRMLPGVDPRVARHVVVFAVFQYVFTEVVPDAAVLAAERPSADEHPDNIRAWSFVQAYGYHEILTKFQINWKNNLRRE